MLKTCCRQVQNLVFAAAHVTSVKALEAGEQGAQGHRRHVAEKGV
jgi:hypothetical protein